MSDAASLTGENANAAAAASAPGTPVALPQPCVVITYNGRPLEAPDGVHYWPSDPGSFRQLHEDYADLLDIEDERVRWRLERGRPAVPPARILTDELRERCRVISCAACGVLYGTEDGGGCHHLSPAQTEQPEDFLHWDGWRQRQDGRWVCPDDVDHVDHVDQVDRAGQVAKPPAPVDFTTRSRANAGALLRALLAVFLLMPAAGLVVLGERVSAAIALWAGLIVLALVISVSTPARRAHGISLSRRVIRWCAR